MTLRWGICSTGRICNDFCSAVKTIPESEHQIVSVVSRTSERAKEFAVTFGIPTTYSSYEEFAKNPNTDVVYIGSIPQEHKRLCLLMLNAGKHVLCEKPLTLTARYTKMLNAVAKEKHLFLMEVMTVDGCIIFTFSKVQKACCTYSSKIVTEANNACIYGIKGYIEIEDKFWAPKEVTLPSGRFTNELSEGPVPFIITHSSGLRYEAMEVRKCIQEGLTECPEFTHKNSEMMYTIMDEVAKQIGKDLQEQE